MSHIKCENSFLMRADSWIAYCYIRYVVAYGMITEMLSPKLDMLCTL